MASGHCHLNQFPYLMKNYFINFHALFINSKKVFFTFQCFLFGSYLCYAFVFTIIFNNVLIIAFQNFLEDLLVFFFKLDFHLFVSN